MSGIPISMILAAQFPSGAKLTWHERGWRLDYEDWVFDWGLYDWQPRWGYDAKVDVDKSWLVGRIYVTAEKIEGDCDPVWKEHVMGSTCFVPEKPTPRPDWFAE